MTYHLGIDLGTTYVGAALIRDGRPSIITLGDRAAVVPSVLYFKEDGEVLTGAAAVRRGLSDPARVVREFKRRVGDTTPVMVGATPYSPDALMAQLLRKVEAAATERQGTPPAGIGITHPANWGPYKIDVLNQAIRMAEVGEVTTLTEPEAAAIHYAFTERLDPGGIVAVYDLGGGTFDAAVLRKTDAGGGFELLGEAEGIERLGGIDFDEAVFQHAVRWAGQALSDLDPNAPATLQAVARLREDCVAAKEALSSDTDVAIPVLLPNLQTEVRLTRSEFEAMIRPAITQTIEAMGRALRSAGVSADQLTAVLLVGGSSRIPLIAQMVGAELGRPIAVDVHPKHTVALGAAIAASATDGTLGNTDLNDAGAWEIQEVAAGGEQREEPAGAPVHHELAQPAANPPSEETARRPAAATATLTEVRPTLDPAPRPPGTPPAEERPIPDGRPSRLAMAGAGVAVLLLLLLGAWALSRGSAEGAAALEDTTTAVSEPDETAQASTSTTTGTEDPDVSESTLAATTPSTVAATTTRATTTTTLAEADGLVVKIDEITVVDGEYHVVYSTNYDPLIGSDPDDHHIHFFFDTVEVSEAGRPGAGPWKLYDTPSPFSGYTEGDRPAGATRMCATAATNDHAVVDPSLFSCLDLPDAGAATAADLLVATDLDCRLEV